MKNGLMEARFALTSGLEDVGQRHSDRQLRVARISRSTEIILAGVLVAQLRTHERVWPRPDVQRSRHAPERAARRRGKAEHARCPDAILVVDVVTAQRETEFLVEIEYAPESCAQPFRVVTTGSDSLLAARVELRVDRRCRRRLERPDK